MLKQCLTAGLLWIMLAGPALAEPDPLIPWAQPQTFEDSNAGNNEVPIFERAMQEERRQKEEGFIELPKSENQEFKGPDTKEETFQVLKRQAKGPQVKAVQKALLSLGFGLPAGDDGDYGGQTVSAVKAFQSSVSLPVTGILNQASFDILNGMKPKDGKKVWEDSASAAQSVPEAPVVKDKTARVLIDLSEYRLSVYDSAGVVQRVFPVAKGAKETPTDVGIKVVAEKLADPTALAEKLWPDSKGQAFGKRLIDLNWYDPATGSQTVSDEELHGTFVLDSIGSPASHGCVRLTNDSIEWLYQNLSVGDLVVIRE